MTRYKAIWPHVPWYILCVIFVNPVYGYPGPCTDLTTIHFLRYITSELHGMPPGVELVFDEVANAHAYRLTSRARTLSFPAATFLTRCDYFPEEFSVLITFKTNPRTLSKQECIFSIVPPGSTRTKFGVRLTDKKIHLDYTDGVSGRRHQVSFKESVIYDGGWHSIVVTVTADEASLRTDCKKAVIKKIARRFPSYLNVRYDNIHLGNCNKDQRGQFTGLIKDLVLLPGADISRKTCPSPRPNLPDLPAGPGEPPHWHPEVAQCTYQDTGKLNYDFYRNSLQVCFSGIWQAVVTETKIDKNKKVDYVVWHQDLVTAAPTIDIDIFRIPKEGLFMATASFDKFDRKLKKQQSAIFKWDSGRFTMYQSLYTLGAQGWEHFQVGKKFFLAVANYGGKRDKPSKSIIYRWSKKHKQFREHQDLITWTARDIEHFVIDGTSYLAVANHAKDSVHEIDSAIYRWEEERQKFVTFQNITTYGAYDWTYFRLQEFHFIAVANSLNEKPFPTTRLQSAIYVWQDGKFLPFQRIETIGATDWEFFTINSDYYLAVANAVSYGPHTTAQSNRYKTLSTVYRLNTKRDLPLFEKYQEIVTYSIVDWEFFRIGDDFYLLASNAQQEVGLVEQEGMPLSRTRSVLYRWQGVEKFVPVHYLDALPAADWEVFHTDGETYLAYANAKDSISQIFRVKLK